MDIDITRLSSKGQIVIPQRMRAGFSEGEKLVIIQNDNQIILKKTDAFRESIEEDLKFAKKTEEAFRRVESGEFIQTNSENLFEEMDRW